MKRTKRQIEVVDPLVGKYFITSHDPTGAKWYGRVTSYLGYKSYGVRMYMVEKCLAGGESPRQQILTTPDMEQWDFFDTDQLTELAAVDRAAIKA